MVFLVTLQNRRIGIANCVNRTSSESTLVYILVKNYTIIPQKHFFSFMNVKLALNFYGKEYMLMLCKTE